MAKAAKSTKRGNFPPVRPPRRTFLVTLGTAPAVVTETLWALMRRDPPWVPDRIEIIATSQGAPGVVKDLMVLDGPLASLFAGRPVPPVTVLAPLRDPVTIPVPAVRVDWVPGHGPPTTTGNMAEAMTDVNDAEAATCMGDLILERLRAAKEVPGDEVHLSISGGRKTMSAHALFSLGLVGDLTDQASHVLMDTTFEYNRQFWHPDQGGLIHTADVQKAFAGRPAAEWPAPTLDPRQAADTLRLFAIAAPRYDLIPGAGPKGAPPPRLSEIMAQLELAGEWRRAPRMVLDVARNAVRICGVERELDATDFVWLRLLATAADQDWTCDRDHPTQPAGAVTAARLLFARPGYGVLVDLAQWEAAAIRAAEAKGGTARLAAARQAGLSRTQGRDDGEAGQNLASAVNVWRERLAAAAGRGEGALQSAQRHVIAELRGRIGSFTELRTHLEDVFGPALAHELVPPSDGAKGTHLDLPRVAHRLGGARTGFLTVVGA